MDRIVASAWKFDGPGRLLQIEGGRRLGGADRMDAKAFVWRQGRDEVRLAHEGDEWIVSYMAPGKLLGPLQLVYQARHKRATHAAWDVMARVIRVSRDEDEGVRVGRSAARWMRANGSFTTD